MTNLSELFNPAAVTDASTSKKDSDRYIVKYNDGVNGTYKSIIRFVPYFADPSHSVVEKTTTWLKNPVTGNGMYVDDPRTVGEYSPVNDMYWKLMNTKIATYADFAKSYIGTQRKYASLVQIVSDEQHPELVGQIKVFVYGKKIHDKLVQEQSPAAGDGINPFHPIYGRFFCLLCTNQSGYNNVDQSYFFDMKQGTNNAPSGIRYKENGSEQLLVATEQSSQQAIAEYLEKNSPDLSRYGYQPWSDRQRQHVEETLAVIENYLTTGTLQKSSSQNQQQQQNSFQSNQYQQPFQQQVQQPQPQVVFPGATQQPMNTNNVAGVVLPNVAPQQSAPSSNNESIVSNFGDINDMLDSL